MQFKIKKAFVSRNSDRLGMINKLLPVKPDAPRNFLTAFVTFEYLFF
jgi:hypothetical protein